MHGSIRSGGYAHVGFKRYDRDSTRFVLEFNEPEEKWRLTVVGRNL
jgi:hypothetical protein